MIPPLRIAHRGASGRDLAPENTLAAFEKALDIGVDMLEIDVRVTGDGQLIVLHDPSLDRTTDCEGIVREMGLDEIRQADAGDGERVPILREVFDLARNRAPILLEIKSDFIAERVVQAIADAQIEEQVVVQSFNPQTVERVKRLAPHLPSSLLIGELPTTPSRVRARRLVSQVLEVGANTLSIWHATLTPSLIEEMRKRGIAVWAWTVDEEITMRDLAMMGVQGLVTNYPDVLNNVLDDLMESGQAQPPLGRRRLQNRGRWARRRQLRKMQAMRQGD
ncbi:MAG: glycerophosphodiester phosphodiesterase family protein [Candidatus Latescibacterota bacterium]|nr:glycerophosphodiester phosphodiesterase family protein [Candidatus Latescibacterota bacterium]MEE2726017.1 glycerophosphodiester phosphodiesterase family protein [Candidatus Latescibacterota bacterium]